MKQFWKFSWDLTAVIVGIYTGFRIFLLVGEKLPMFGYFPVGVICGLFILGITAVLVHAVEGLIAYGLFKCFGIDLENFRNYQ